ncbi:hypothetical protein ACFWCB_24795 [Streptomyces sp. NPDC060048]|uniref:hypothetical protein n=1 Tax=unclassified Streptomyces TaxID=2593676 RepID=UPI0036ADB5F5
MHSYDVSRAPSYPSSGPPTRPVRELDSAPAASHTPIYDTLYSEYLRAFRALPGDRTGEEHLGFTAFSYGGAYGSGAYPAGSGAYPAGSGTYGVGSGTYGVGSGASYAAGWNGSSWQPANAWQPSSTPQPQHAYAGASASTGYANGRQHQTGTHHVPAALPPAPRRGH